jgi:hypothetical protein
LEFQLGWAWERDLPRARVTQYEHPFKILFGVLGNAEPLGALVAHSYTFPKGVKMTKLSYLLAAAAALAIATPSFAQDAPKAGVTINQGGAPAGEVKRDEAKPQEGRGEMRRDGNRDQGRMEVRGERRDGDRREVRGDRREMRSGVRVAIGERDRGERRWYRARAQHVVVVHHRHRRHHH